MLLQCAADRNFIWIIFSSKIEIKCRLFIVFSLYSHILKRKTILYHLSLVSRHVLSIETEMWNIIFLTGDGCGHMVMSQVLSIPLLTQRLPEINRWWFPGPEKERWKMWNVLLKVNSNVLPRNSLKDFLRRDPTETFFSKYPEALVGWICLNSEMSVCWLVARLLAKCVSEKMPEQI